MRGTVCARGDPRIGLGARYGVPDYGALVNLPTLNGVRLIGDLTSADVGITPEALGLGAAQGAVGEAVSEALEEALAGAEMSGEELDGILNED